MGLQNSGPPPDTPGIYLIANPPGGNVAQWLYNWAMGTNANNAGAEQKAESKGNESDSNNGHPPGVNSQIHSSDGGQGARQGLDDNSSNMTSSGGQRVQREEESRMMIPPDGRLQGDKTVNSEGMLHLLPPILNWLASGGQGGAAELIGSSPGWKSSGLEIPKEKEGDLDVNNNKVGGISKPHIYSPENGATTDIRPSGRPTATVPVTDTSLTSVTDCNGASIIIAGSPRLLAVTPSSSATPAFLQFRDLVVVSPARPETEELLKLTASTSLPPPSPQLRKQEFLPPAGTNNIVAYSCQVSTSASAPQQAPTQSMSQHLENQTGVSGATSVQQHRSPTTDDRVPSWTPLTYDDESLLRRTPYPTQEMFENDLRGQDKSDCNADNNGNVIPPAAARPPPPPPPTPTSPRGGGTLAFGPMMPPSLSSFPSTVGLSPGLRLESFNPPQQQPQEIYPDSRPGTLYGQSGVAASSPPPVYNVNSVVPGYPAKKFIPINPNNSRNSEPSGVSWSSNFAANPTVAPSSFHNSPPSARGNVSFFSVPNSVSSDAPVSSSVPVSSVSGANYNTVPNSINPVPGLTRTPTFSRPVASTSPPATVGPQGYREPTPNVPLPRERGAQLEQNVRYIPAAMTKNPQDNPGQSASPRENMWPSSTSAVKPEKSVPHSAHLHTSNYTATTETQRSVPTPTAPAPVARQGGQPSAPPKDLPLAGNHGVPQHSPTAAVNFYQENGNNLTQTAFETAPPQPSQGSQLAQRRPFKHGGFDVEEPVPEDSTEVALMNELVRDATHFMKMMTSSTSNVNGFSMTSPPAPPSPQFIATPPPSQNQPVHHQHQVRTKSEFSLALAAELPFATTNATNQTNLIDPARLGHPNINSTGTSQSQHPAMSPYHLFAYSHSTPHNPSFELGFTLTPGDYINGNTGWNILGTPSSPSPTQQHQPQMGKTTAAAVTSPGSTSTRVFDSTKLKAWVLEVVANACQGHCGKSPSECQEHTMKYLMAMVTSWRNLYAKSNGRFQFLDSEHFLSHVNDVEL